MRILNRLAATHAYKRGRAAQHYEQRTEDEHPATPG
jgi:hypothetical protein